MSASEEIYRIATEKFLVEFDVHWQEVLKLLEENQLQLSVGNRLRPQICLWGYLATVAPEKVVSHDYSQIARVAVSIELIHKASLILDDWIDGDIARHGNPTFHVEYDPKYAVIFALTLISLAMFRLRNVFSDLIVPPQCYVLCMNTLVETVYAMAKGALNEIRLKDMDIFNSDAVKEIVRLETSEILGNSLLLGYYAGAGDQCNPGVERIFKCQGDKCGYFFQAFNDLEAFGDPEQLKGHKGTLNFDVLSNRKNIAVSYLYEIANKKDRVLLQNADAQTLICLMKKYKVVDCLRANLSAVYESILSAEKEFSALGLPAEWCLGMRWFFSTVKKYAEIRLDRE